MRPMPDGRHADESLQSVVRMVLVPDIDQLIARLDRIQELTEQLAKAQGDIAEQQDISERIRREIMTVKATLNLLGPPFAS